MRRRPGAGRIVIVDNHRASLLAATLKVTGREYVPRQPVPQLAVVNVFPTTLPFSSRILTVTFASKTFAVPETVTGLETRAPAAGLSTSIAGSRSA